MTYLLLGFIVALLIIIAIVINKTIELYNAAKSLLDVGDKLIYEGYQEENRLLKLGLTSLHKKGEINYPSKHVISHVLREGEIESELIMDSIEEIKRD